MEAQHFNVTEQALSPSPGAYTKQNLYLQHTDYEDYKREGRSPAICTVDSKKPKQFFWLVVVYG